MVGGGEGGTGGGEGGQSAATYWVRLGALAAGNYEFDLVYIPAGASEPSKHRIGVISQGATTPGYYYTVSYTHQVV